MRTRKLGFLGISLLLLGVAGCKGLPPSQIHLMPAPEIFDEGFVDPLPDTHPLETIPYAGVLFATDRLPSVGEEEYYGSDRGLILRLGVGSLKLGDGTYTWEEARRISLQNDRAEEYPLSITSIEEFGFLEESYTPFLDPASVPDDWAVGGERFAGAIDAKLAISDKKDIYVYVHGFKTVFENPLLVAAELWHFMGYDGAFVAYSWPATPSLFAYASDIETARLSARNLKLFLSYLARETQAERIHVVGYSAGTRVVIGALDMFASLPAREDLRLGHVVLISSDYDRQLFGTHVLDGILEVPEDLTIYESASDKALGMSTRVFARNRLGQTLTEGFSDPTREYLRQTENIIPIDVTDAVGSAEGNGHHYFETSPWVSGDLLMLLMNDMEPQERGLERKDGEVIWSFPPDYVARLRAALEAQGGGL